MTRAPVVLRGRRAVAASTTGVALVVEDFRAWRSLPPGRIVVARHATPDAVLVMERARGVVFEVGGVAAHAAIIARELGVPCVVGVEHALATIRDGDRVHIDGMTGEVHVGG